MFTLVLFPVSGRAKSYHASHRVRGGLFQSKDAGVDRRRHSIRTVKQNEPKSGHHLRNAVKRRKKMKHFLMKFGSIKTWLVIFCAVIIAAIVFTKQSDFNALALVVPVTAYFPANVFQKKILGGGK
jgi:hypothetical protein